MTDTQDKRTPENEGLKKPKTQKQPPALAHLADKRAKNLRDNLLKRKQQARARNAADPAPDTSSNDQ